MEDIKLEIKEYYDMLNLHKALLEAKFHQNPDNVYVAGSPIIAKICNDLLYLLTEYDIKKKGKDDWTEWRKIKNQDFYKKRAIEGIVRFGRWNEISGEDKKNTVYNYLSPFTSTEVEINELIKELDDKDIKTVR